MLILIMAYFGGFGCCFDVIVFLSCGKEKGRLKSVLPEWTLPPVSLYLVTPYRVQSAKTEAAVRIFTESFAKEGDL